MRQVKQKLFLVLFSITVAGCLGCTSRASSQQHTNATGSAEGKTETALSKDTSDAQKLLTEAYIQAIKHFITAVEEKDHLSMDTLFIAKRRNGQPDDFPDLELPATIQNVAICLVADNAVAQPKHLFRPKAPFVNMMGWVEEAQAEFLFVAFYPEFKHQYDCYLNYNYDTQNKTFVLESQRIEVVINGADGKPDHLAVYEKGKYVGDKPIH